MPLVLLGTVLLLAASLVGALLGGRSGWTSFGMPYPSGLYTGRGVTLDYPDDGIASRPGIPSARAAPGWRSSPPTARFRPAPRTRPPWNADAPPPQPLPSADGVVYMGNQQGRITGVEDRIYAGRLNSRFSRVNFGSP